MQHWRLLPTQGWSCLGAHPEELEPRAQALGGSWRGLFVSSGVILRTPQCSVPKARVEAALLQPCRGTAGVPAMGAGTAPEDITYDFAEAASAWQQGCR